MSREIISVPVVRKTKTKTATAAYTETEAAVAGSPFECRLYRNTQGVFIRDEKSAGVATIERRVLSFEDVAAPVKIGDIATLPDGTKAKIQRVRSYDRSLQCDLEEGSIQ